MESENQDSMDSEFLMFLLSILHNLGHRALDLRGCVRLLRTSEMAHSKSAMKVAERISEVADALAADLRLIRLLGVDRDLVSCDFLVEVLQPAISLISFMYELHYKFRLNVERSVREAPQVQLRPSLARQGLVKLITATKPREIRCAAIPDKDHLVVSLILYPVIQPLAANVQDSLSYLFSTAEASIQESVQHKNVYSLRLQLRVEQ